MADKPNGQTPPERNPSPPDARLERVTAGEFADALAKACGVEDLNNCIKLQVTVERGVVMVNVTRMVVQTFGPGARGAVALLRDWECELTATKPVADRMVTAAGEVAPHWASKVGVDSPAARRE